MSQDLLSFPENTGTFLILTMPLAFRWFRVYCALLAVLYLGIVGLGVWFLFGTPEEWELPLLASRLIGTVFILTGFFLAFAAALGPFLPQRDWAWLFGFALLCLGLTSIVLLPLSLPIMIFWRKEPVKTWFGRFDS